LYIQCKKLYHIALSNLRRKVRDSDDEKLTIRYQEMVKEAIHPFLAAQRFAEALELAAKYEDFETLIYLCEGTNYFGEDNEATTGIQNIKEKFDGIDKK